MDYLSKELISEIKDFFNVPYLDFIGIFNFNKEEMFLLYECGKNQFGAEIISENLVDVYKIEEAVTQGKKVFIRYLTNGIINIEYDSYKNVTDITRLNSTLAVKNRKCLKGKHLNIEQILVAEKLSE